MPNPMGGASRRYASPLGAGQQFVRALFAPPALSAEVAHLWHTTRMATTSTSTLQRRLMGGLLWGVILTGCVGCQTFSLSDEDFQKQQRGEMVDRETGKTVGAVGTVGYLGAIVGEAVAGAGRR